MAIPYDSIDEGTSTVASEPQVAFENAAQFAPRPHIKMNSVPEDCMSLERFGELFHQKLDACYAGFVIVDRIIPSKMMVD